MCIDVVGQALITGMAYDPEVDADLATRSLKGLIPSSSAKIAYLKNNYLPSYIEHFIAELLTAAQAIKA